MGRIRPTRRTRSAAKSPLEYRTRAKSCRCTIHNSISTDEPSRIFCRTSHDYRQSERKWLIEKGFLGPRDAYFCCNCLNYAPQHGSDPPSSDGSSPHDGKANDNDDMDEDSESDGGNGAEQTEVSSCPSLVDVLVEKISAGDVSMIDCDRLCKALGKALSSAIYEDTVKLGSAYQDLEATERTECAEYIQKRCQPLVSFFEGIMLTNHEENVVRKEYALCLAIEQIYFLRNLRYVGQFSFAQGLVQWTFHGSKAAHTLGGGTTAAGSVTTLRNVLKNMSKEENKCFDASIDMEVHADNTQRTQKTGRVREDGTTPLGVATNVVFIECNSSQTSNLQTRNDLRPSEWIGKLSRFEISSKVHDIESQLNTEVLRPFRFHSQKDMLNTVKAESQGKDHVSLRITNTDLNYVVCSKCCEKFPRQLTICRKCGHNSNNLKDRSSLYGSIPHGFQDRIATRIEIGELIGVNPNSKDNIKQVLENIQQQALVGKERAWVRVGFDGLPYRMAAELVRNTVICFHCGEQYDLSKVSMSMHLAICGNGGENGNTVDEPQYHLAFGGILLVPGAGHTEKNLLLALFTLLRHVVIEKVAHLLGFRSKNAKKFIVGCSNHHVSWQIMMIMYQAFAMELLYQYGLSRGSREFSVKEFIEWKENVVNPNYNFMYDVVFNCMLGLVCFRNGVRRGNSSHMLAGRQKVAPLMFIGRHMIYRKLLYNDMAVRVEAPPEVAHFIRQNESFSRSGDPCRGEGGDYVTENENRALKSNLPPGAPTLANWQVASRCHKKLVANRDSVFNKAGLNDPAHVESSVFNFDNEVQMLRATIRESGMLSDPLEERLLVALDGTPLQPDLVNFYVVATDNYEKYMKDPECEFTPVFVTSEDEKNYNDVNNWTIAKIQKETNLVIDKFIDQDRAEMFKGFMKSSVKLKKAEQIDFYSEVQKDLEDQLASVSDDVIDEE